MNVKEIIKTFLADVMGSDTINLRLDENLKSQEKLAARMGDLENRIVENTRALATLAIVQASLVREMSEYIESKEKPKYKKAQHRNTGPDFTN